MERYESRIGVYDLSVWSERAPKPHASQDGWLVDPRENGLRLAVLDGCTPMDSSVRHAGVDGGAWAAAVVRAALLVWQPADRCLVAANRLLCDETVRVSQARNQAAAVVADLGSDGELWFCRAHDCEAWISDAGVWREVFPHNKLQTEALARYEAWKAAHPRASNEQLQTFEEELLGQPEVWHTTAIGRFSEPLLEWADLPVVPEKLVLASDGARLTAERLTDLDGWLARLRDWERATIGAQVAGDKPHDDVTVLRLQRR
jgi:hypothetical protein